MAPANSISLRRWAPSDADSLVQFANNRNIWLRLKDRFPHPYTRLDADLWIGNCMAAAGPASQFAIDLDGLAIGGVGFDPLGDVQRITAEVGYWIGEPFWNRGFATAALLEITRYAFAEFPLQRLQALVFEGNTASCRVLEKAGYTFELRIPRCIVKDGRIADGLLYGRMRE
jgi:[ribosomal protein S5]-alanine N-acetyltransferase